LSSYEYTFCYFVSSGSFAQPAFEKAVLTKVLTSLEMLEDPLTCEEQETRYPHLLSFAQGTLRKLDSSPMQHSRDERGSYGSGNRAERATYDEANACSGNASCDLSPRFEEPSEPRLAIVLLIGHSFGSYPMRSSVPPANASSPRLS
jgi:hypothetical protein